MHHPVADTPGSPEPPAAPGASPTVCFSIPADSSGHYHQPASRLEGLLFSTSGVSPMFLSRLAIVAVALFAIASVGSAAEHWVFLGTYTGKDGSKGIYRCKLDDATGKLSEPE